MFDLLTNKKNLVIIQPWKKMKKSVSIVVKKLPYL